MKSILVVMGTRPEAIKLAPVVLALKRQPQAFRVTVCVTAQHRQMLDQVLRLFHIEPDLDLNLMEANQTLPSLTARAMLSVSQAIKECQPDTVMVQGDTTTAMVTALAAFYQRVPVGHVEAGLRTGNPQSPFPEEINRRLIGVLGDMHFAPTTRAADALRAEGVPRDRVHLTGNTVVDALHMIASRPVRVIPRIGFDDRRLILVTAHRRESFGEPLERICRALRELADRHPDVAILYPVHPNPSVREPVERLLLNVQGVFLLDPLEYEEFVHLMKRSYLVLTDSGGIQEEAPALGKPVLVMRNETERPEALEAGTSRLVGTDTETILYEVERLLNDRQAYARMATAVSPFGDGRAAERILMVLASHSVSPIESSLSFA